MPPKTSEFAKGLRAAHEIIRARWLGWTDMKYQTAAKLLMQDLDGEIIKAVRPHSEGPATDVRPLADRIRATAMAMVTAEGCVSALDGVKAGAQMDQLLAEVAALEAPKPPDTDWAKVGMAKAIGELKLAIYNLVAAHDLGKSPEEAIREARALFLRTPEPPEETTMLYYMR